jgi:hypothetical protein
LIEKTLKKFCLNVIFVVKIIDGINVVKNSLPLLIALYQNTKIKWMIIKIISKEKNKKLQF